MFPGPLGVLPRHLDPSMGFPTMGISLALLLACVLFQPGFCDSSSTNTLTINSVNSCDICKCGFLDLKCHGKSLIVKSLPDFVREIEISDAKEGGVVFERGAIRVRDESSVFKVVVSKASIVEFREKSTTILVANGSVNVNLREIAHLKMKRRSVSSSSGNFELFVSQSVQVSTFKNILISRVSTH